MNRGRLHFVLSLTLLAVLLVLAIAAPYGRKRTTLGPDPEHGAIAVIAGDGQIAVMLLPLLFSLAAALGALGCLQFLSALPDVIRRSTAWAFAVGTACHGLAHYRVATNQGFDFEARFAEARWIAFLGTVLLLYALLVSVLGIIRFRPERHRAPLESPSALAGGHDMAARIYSWGGLLLLLWMTLRISKWVWPWLPPQSEGMTAVMASFFAFPLVIALGAVALVLSVFQPVVDLPKRLKVACAILYFLGTIRFFSGMFQDLQRDRSWDTAFSWPTSAGLALLLLVLLLNLVGLVRHRPVPAAPAQPAAD